MQFVSSNLGLNVCLFAIGLWMLIKGSNSVIESASSVARHYGIPDMVIGLTLVSIGTSLPELVTNVYAAIIDQGVVAMGNVVGSNITNILLVAGIAVTGLGCIKIDKITFQRDALAMTLSYVLLATFAYLFHGDESILERWEGIVLIAAFCLYLRFLLKSGGNKTECTIETSQNVDDKPNLFKAFGFILLACCMLIIGAKLMVDTVVWTARFWNIPEEIISALIIALGTSLPEISVTIAGIRKKKKDIALGNIIGSNTFNIVLVMGVTALISPVQVSPEIRFFMLPYMLFTGFLFVIFMRSSWSLVRWEGVVFLLGYIFFIGFNLRRIYY